MFSSCFENQSIDIKRVEDILESKIECNYKVENYQYDVGIGSSTLIYDLQFSEEDFKILLKNLKINRFEKSNNFYYKNQIKDGFNVRILLFVDKSIIRYSEHDL